MRTHHHITPPENSSLVAVPRLRDSDRHAGAPIVSKSTKITAPLLACALATLGLLAACDIVPPVQPDLTRFYVLTAEANKSDATTPASATPVRVALRPIELPDFLNGRMIEVRVAENEVRFIDQARWAEPLDSGLAQALHEDLERAGTLRLTPRALAHDYDVVVHLRECEGISAAHTARMAAHIEIVTAGLDPKVVAEDEFSTEVPGWNGTDYADLAKKLSEATAKLGDRIVTLVPAAK